MNRLNLRRFILDGVHHLSPDGLCNKYIHAADDLVRVAKDLRRDLAIFKMAPDPFAALVSTVHNNQEFDKFMDHAVDRTVNRV